MSSYAFLVMFQPYSSFLVPFFVENVGITAQQVYSQVFPVWTYAYFLSLLLFGILSECFGYKYLILFGLLSNIATLLIMLSSKHLIAMQISQITMGLWSTSFILFSSYLYLVVPNKAFYQKITSYVRGAYLFGTVLSAILGQLLISQTHIKLVGLVYISLIALILALLVYLPVPNINKPYINRVSIRDIVQDIFTTYKTVNVSKYTLWGGMWLAIHHLVLTYWQSLFYEISSTQVYYGYVYAAAYLLASCAAILPTLLEKQMEYLSEVFLVVFPLVGGLLLVVSALTNNVFIAYAMFILYHSVYEFMSPVVSAQIAKSMPTYRFGLIFTINVIVAMVVQTVVQTVISACKLSIRHQFLVFGACVLFITFVYSIGSLVSYVRKRNNSGYSTL